MLLPLASLAAADAAAAATSRQQPGDPAVSPCGTAEFTTRTVWIGSDRKEADGRDFEVGLDACALDGAASRRVVTRRGQFDGGVAGQWQHGLYRTLAKGLSPNQNR